MIKEKSIQEVLEVARIEEVIGDFMNLRKRGANFIGLCPFHNEKTPSFTVSPAKGIFKCFGCGAAGNASKFLMEHEQMSFPEAIRNLATRYNVELEETGNTDEQQETRKHKESLFIVAAYARDYYKDQLNNTDVGRSVGLGYFRERGFSDELIDRFDLGFAPNQKDALVSNAEENGFSKELLKEVGLASEKEGRWFDFFRDRVQFTIHNLSGKPIAFAGRVLQSNSKAPKYINSPETEIYNKSRVLYGIHQARNAIRKMDNCILVEGYTDVLRLAQEGVENVVASSGTALTEGQIKLIKRFTSNLTILYDGDAAGVKAALRGLDLVLEQDMNVKLVILPENHDPDSYARDKGGEALQDYIDQKAKDFIYFKIGLYSEEAQKDPVTKTELVRSVVESISLIPDPIKRSLYTQECSSLLNIDEAILTQEINKSRRKILRKKTSVRETDIEQMEKRFVTEREKFEQNEKLVPLNEFQEKHIIRLLLEYGDKQFPDGGRVDEFILSGIEDKKFISNPTFQRILAESIKLYNEGKTITAKPFINHQDEAISEASIDLLSFPYIFSKNWEEMYDYIVPEPSENFVKDVQYSIINFKFRRVLSMLREIEEILASTNDEEKTREAQLMQVALMEKRKSFSDQLGQPVVMPK